MKIKVFESEWHDIKFNKLGVKLSIFKKADLDFYNKFYKIFFSRYNNFEDLSIKWRNGKIEVAKLIEKNIAVNASVLSYGCGIGFLEKYITEIRNDISLDCFDFSDLASKWLRRDLKKLNFISDHNKLKKYDFIFMVELLYAMSDKEIISLLKEVKNFLKDKGRVIISSTSLDSSENGIEQLNFFRSILKKIKDFIRPFYYFLFKNKEIQFWGYQRNRKSYEQLFVDAGYTSLKNFSGSQKSFQIFEIIKK